MSGMTFGSFAMMDPHGGVAAAVVIAPEYILLQRPPSTEVHDLSYLATWSPARVARLQRELATLRSQGSSPVDAASPELATILRAIDPTTTAIFCHAGDCSRAFARRRLRAALKTAGDARRTAASSRQRS